MFDLCDVGTWLQGWDSRPLISGLWGRRATFAPFLRKRVKDLNRQLRVMSPASYLITLTRHEFFELCFHKVRIEFAHIFDDVGHIAVSNDRIEFQLVSCLNLCEARTF